ncbi:hypothetical protein ABZ297_40945 [Nonomuraea sp. NPDC005983]|uniref:hypothetical protein n=1 Tax=Nonomuraea sp. NPDC005983 TaxID=3155595 RepID=UPI0033A6843C
MKTKITMAVAAGLTAIATASAGVSPASASTTGEAVAAPAAGRAGFVAAPAARQTGVSAAAATEAHHGHDSIRYASIKGCSTKDGAPKPCGKWRLVMHDGMTRLLPDAQTTALDAKGKPAVYNAAPIAVSGNGRSVAYFTKSGRLAVRTLGGGVKLLAKDALPRVAQYDVTLKMSDDGAKLAAALGGDKPKATRLFDTATGRLLGTVPAEETPLGFSADGGELLASADGGESVTDLTAYSDTGERLLKATPPQVVSANGPQALSGDGRTVANVVRSRKPELVLWDMQTDQVTRKKIKLPAGDLMMVDWTGETQVTLHLQKGSTITIVQIDTETGAVRQRDRYAFLKDTFVFAACGG